MFYLCYPHSKQVQPVPEQITRLELSLGVAEIFSKLHYSLKLLLPNPFSFLLSQISDLHHDLKVFLTYFYALFHRSCSQGVSVISNISRKLLSKRLQLLQQEETGELELCAYTKVHT